MFTWVEKVHLIFSLSINIQVFFFKLYNYKNRSINISFYDKFHVWDQHLYITVIQ